jgi:hypothetical protein
MYIIGSASVEIFLIFKENTTEADRRQGSVQSWREYRIEISYMC